MRIGRIATGNIFKVALDMFRVSKVLAKGQYEERVDYAHLEAYVKKPMIGLAPHLGSWELGAMCIGRIVGEASVRYGAGPTPHGTRGESGELSIVSLSDRRVAAK